MTPLGKVSRVESSHMHALGLQGCTCERRGREVMTSSSPPSLSMGQLATFRVFRLLRVRSSARPASVMFWQKLRLSSRRADSPDRADMSQSRTTRNLGACSTRQPPRFRFWRLASGDRTARSGSGGTILAYFRLSSVSWVRRDNACMTRHPA